MKVRPRSRILRGQARGQSVAIEPVPPETAIRRENGIMFNRGVAIDLCVSGTHVRLALAPASKELRLHGACQRCLSWPSHDLQTGPITRGRSLRTYTTIGVCVIRLAERATIVGTGFASLRLRRSKKSSDSYPAISLVDGRAIRSHHPRPLQVSVLQSLRFPPWTLPR